MHIRDRIRTAEVSHVTNIAMSVVDVALNNPVITDRGIAQPIAHLQRRAVATILYETCFAVSVGACPARLDLVAAAMLYLKEVTGRVMKVALEVVAHRIPVVGGPVNTDAGRIIVRRMCRCAANLAEMLASGGFDKPVGGVISVVARWLNASVAKVDDLLGIIPDMCNVAYRVVAVVQVLYFSRASRPEAVVGSRSKSQVRYVVSVVGLSGKSADRIHRSC